MGDELLLDIFAAQLAPRQLCIYPRNFGELISYVRSIRPSGRPELLLGGGTFIGGPWWRAHLERSAVLVQHGRASMVGAGAMGALPGEPDHKRTAAEIARWRPILRRMEEVTVRGPLTQQLLDDVGIDSRVVGDPGLLADLPARPTVPQLLGITLGPTSGFGDADAHQIIRTIVDAVVRVSRTTGSWSVRVVGANLEDAEVTTQLAEQLSAAHIEVDAVVAPVPEAFAQLVAPCDVFVGQRLHSVVVATVLGVPSLMLSYALKCDDFMASISRQGWAVPIRRLDPALIADQLIDLHHNRVLHVVELESQTARLRGELEDAFASLRQG